MIGNNSTQDTSLDPEVKCLSYIFILRIPTICVHIPFHKHNIYVGGELTSVSFREKKNNEIIFRM